MLDLTIFLTTKFWFLLTILFWPLFTTLGILWGMGQAHRGEMATWLTGIFLSLVFTVLFFVSGVVGAQLIRLLLYLGV